MKILRILKIVLLVFLFGGALYLILMKGEKKVSENQIQNSGDESDLPQETKFLDTDGTYNFKDEKLIVSVHLPDESTEYVDDMYKYGDEQIQRFVSSREEIENIDSASFPWNLDMDYKKYESDTVVSYVVQGYEYTGGAHGNSFLKSFNFDKKTGKQIGVQDIISSENSLNTLSALAKKELVVEYPEGVDSREDNWSVWYADDTSVTFIFMPYQIASYATGQQELKIEITDKNRALFQEKYF